MHIETLGVEAPALVEKYAALVATLRTMRSNHASVELQLPKMRELTDLCFKLQLLGEAPWKLLRADSCHPAGVRRRMVLR